jgi:hypothetical protein
MTTTDLVAATPAPLQARAVALNADVCLTRAEVFDACQVLADADHVLVATGARREAAALADLFELLEDRMTRPRCGRSPSESTGPSGPGGDDPDSPRYGCSGSYSMDSELTQ